MSVFFVIPAEAGIQCFNCFRHSDEGRIQVIENSGDGSFVPQDDEIEELQKYSPVITDTSLDLTISSAHPLDEAIKILQNGGYKIKGIKPKSGRLEEFFLKSTKK